MSTEPNPPDPPAPTPSLRRSLSWTLLGELVFAACQWLTLMIVAKLGSPEALGRYSLGLAVATPVIVLANLHLRPIFVVQRDETIHPFADYLALRLLALPLALVSVALICLARGWPWTTAAVIMLIALIRAAGSVADILYARAQQAERMRSIGVSRALAGLLWLGLLALGLALADELLALTLVVVGSVALLLAYDLPQARAYGSLRPHFDRAALRRLLWMALPMGLAAGLLGVTANVPAYVLERDHGLAEVGFFAAVLSILQGSGVVNLALGNAAVPRLAKLAQADAASFWRMLAKLLGLVALLNGVMLVLMVAFGDLYLELAYTPDYAVYLPELILASVAAIVLGLGNMLSQTLTALGQFRMQLVLNGLALIASTGLALWLIPARGLTGAVWALVGLAIVRLLFYSIANLAIGPRSGRSDRASADDGTA